MNTIPEYFAFVGEMALFDLGGLTDDELVYFDRISKKQEAEGPSSRESRVVYYGDDREDVIGVSPELDRLSAMIERCVGEYLLQSFPDIAHSNLQLDRIGSWLNVGKVGKVVHTHSSDVTALLYIDTTEPGMGGETVFVNPVNPHLHCGMGILQSNYRRALKITPRRAHVLVFPGYLEHYVEEYAGADSRRTFGVDFVALPSK